MIKVQRISRNGLSKQEWCFSIQNLTLVYTSYSLYNRNSRKEFFADEYRPQGILTYEDWCDNNNLDWNDANNENKYLRYKNSFNPVLQKTNDGRTRLSSISCELKYMPECPKVVAKEALEIFKKQLKVVYQS
jgi:hypothetical protein